MHLIMPLRRSNTNLCGGINLCTALEQLTHNIGVTLFAGQMQRIKSIGIR